MSSSVLVWLSVSTLALGAASLDVAPAQAATIPALATAASRAAAPDTRPWPRPFTVDGVTFSLYRPQVETWRGNRLEARAVMAVKTGERTQDYGVVWLTARTETDRFARTV